MRLRSMFWNSAMRILSMVTANMKTVVTSKSNVFTVYIACRHIGALFLCLVGKDNPYLYFFAFEYGFKECICHPFPQNPNCCFIFFLIL